MRYLICLLLAGCATTEEIHRRDAAAIEKRCESLGLQRGTPEFQDCKVRLAAAYK